MIRGEQHGSNGLRPFLHLLAMGMFLGIMVELVALKHYASQVQLIPFVLCGLGAVATAISWRMDVGIRMRRVFQATWVMMAIGSLWGIYEHVEANLGFVRETQPHASMIELLEKTFQGRDPVLAPMALVAAAAVAMAASMVPGAQVPVRSRIRARTFQPVVVEQGRLSNSTGMEEA